MKTTIETITPELAASYLSTSAGNRPISRHQVYNYADQMRNGKWMLNGVSIIFDNNGHLIDGHHRLTAVVNAGVPVQMSVVRGVENRSFTTIDCGILRTAGHVLAMTGIQNWNAVAAVINTSQQLLNKHKITNSNSVNGSIRRTNELTLKLFESDKEGYQHSAEFSRSTVKKANIIKASWIGGMHYYLTHTGGYGTYFVEEFFFQLCSLETSDNEMIESLRKRILKEKVNGKTINDSILFALLAKCWNLYAVGNNTKKVTFTENEEYPKLKTKLSR